MSFIHPEFLLSTEQAIRLYHDYAADCPIHDYHSHLDPARILDNRPFNNLTEIWLEGDHYKWRAMRAAGVEEPFITGDASPEEKFIAWASVVPKTIGNPLYHWTHMELHDPFDVDELLGPDNALDIYEHCTELLQRESFRPRNLLNRWNVLTACTTDDPTDNISLHLDASGVDLSVRPSFRPDNAFAFSESEFPAWLAKLGNVETLDDLVRTLASRADAFNEAGCVASDHGLEQMFPLPADEKIAARTFTKLKNGEATTSEDQMNYRGHLMLMLGRIYHKQDWAQQFHLGAMRNVNSRSHDLLGPDTGFDTIGDRPQTHALAAYMDNLNTDQQLPRTIVYNIDPSQNDALAAMIGVFQDGKVPGKIQFGAAWWFNDQKTGIERQLDSLANMGMLSQFVGMVTDSRSFLSFSRHDYFRRVLCSFLGERMSRGEIPGDYTLVGELVRDVCHRNAARYFGFGTI